MGGRSIWRYLIAPADEMPESIAAPIEHGPGGRRSANLPAARLIVGSSEALCRVSEISAFGFTAEISPAPVVGRQVELELVEGIGMRGVVTSCHSDSIAVAFDAGQDVDVMLGRGPSRGRFRARGVRMRAKGFATLQVEGRVINVLVSNISQFGACVTGSELTMGAGASASLDLDWFGRLAGSIRWAAGDSAGILFAKPLAYERLAHWIWATSRADTR